MERSLSRRDFLRISTAVAGSLILPRSAVAQAQPEVRLSIVKPSNSEIYPNEADNFLAAATRVRSWYYSRIGATFEINPQVDILAIPQTIEEIIAQGENAWQTGLRARNGALSTIKNKLDLILLIGSGYTDNGGNFGNPIAGYAIVNDLVRESLNGIENSQTITCATSPFGPVWQCTRDQADAVLVHELGHSTGLSHPVEGGTGSIMAGDIGSYPERAYFSETERKALLSSPFIR